jgi:hypothetical protein
MEDSFEDVWVIDIPHLVELLSKSEPLQDDLWRLLATTGPSPGRISHHRAVAIGTTIWVYGGLIRNDNEPQSLYTLDTTTATWAHVRAQVLPQPACTCRESHPAEMATVWSKELTTRCTSSAGLWAGNA